MQGNKMQCIHEYKSGVRRDMPDTLMPIYVENTTRSGLINWHWDYATLKGHMETPFNGSRGRDINIVDAEMENEVHFKMDVVDLDRVVDDWYSEFEMGDFILKKNNRWNEGKIAVMEVGSARGTEKKAVFWDKYDAITYVFELLL